MKRLTMLLALMSTLTLCRGQCPTDERKFLPAISSEVNTHAGVLMQAGVIGLQQPFSAFLGLEAKADERPDKTGKVDNNTKLFPRLEVLCRIIPGLHGYVSHDTMNTGVGLVGHLGDDNVVLRIRAGYSREFVAGLGITFVIY